MRWPKDCVPGPSVLYNDFLNMLLQMAGTTFATTCVVKDMSETLGQLFKADSAVDRTAMVASVGMSRQRTFKGVATLRFWDKHSPKRYAPRPDRPRIERQPLPADDGQAQPVVGIRVTATLPRGDGDLARDLGEEGPSLGVVGALLALDRRPFAVSGHRAGV